MDKKYLFIQKIQNLFGARHARVLQHLYTKPPITFRVNTLKKKVPDALKELRALGFIITPGSLASSFIVEKSPDTLSLSQTDLVNNGEIYIQGLSSMVPALLLDPKEGESILDLCAAPGSKTSQIAEMTNNNSEIIAVDNNRNRLFRLTGNMTNQGIQNVKTIYASGVGLERRYRQFISHFDKVLIDAPCSNEGQICLTDPATFEYWNPKLPRKLAQLQKKLVASGIAMLKEGGVLVYSTCTFSREENEDIVVWMLEKFKAMSLVEVKKILPDGVFTGFFAAKFVKLAEKAGN